MKAPALSSMNIRILYEDEWLIAAEKPSGLLSVPGKGAANQDCLIHRVQTLYPTSRIIHRLDMATSGILLVARDLGALRTFSRLFEQRHIDKRYEAIVSGIVDQPQGSIDLPLICDWPNRPRQKVCHDSGKNALTNFQVVDTQPSQQTTRVALYPVTGRSHQLRVHLQAIGHPILGDEFYAPEGVRRLSSRLLLHACELNLTHPFTDESLKITSPVPF